MPSANTPAFEAYLQIDGVQGEATESNHKNWIKMLSFDHSVQQQGTGTISGAGQRVVGKSVHESFSFVKRVDKSSPYLNRELCSGKNIPTAVIEVLHTENSTKNVILKYTLEKVVISAVTIKGGGYSDVSASGEATEVLVPVETVQLDYGKIKWEYNQITDGKKTASTRAEHNLSENTTS